MKAAELRIGNYSCYGIKTITVSLDASDILQIEQGCDEYKPIPLTEERLLQLGLEKKPESEYTMDTYDIVGFNLWMNKDKFLFNDEIEIKYVHHLQKCHCPPVRQPVCTIRRQRAAWRDYVRRKDLPK